ncbi:hypothetical protein BP5796_13002 [Coleophoma crateriformis]|uniref:FAD-binding domain-containing protein n=1 Tax=Coleophoma crateriformis TaxID=565419 RepID=A0A3D8Q516_9HELO|nr:hypothetical protein BP5796_13002 [Coleophoma crateriformis]
MTEVKKAIIIGGGPTGLAMAMLLQLTNRITAVVYEIRHEPSTLGGALGIPPNGLRLLSRLGIYEKLLARGSSATNLVLHSVKGHDLGEMDMVSWSNEKIGFGYLRIKRTDLMAVLLEVADKRGIVVNYGKRISRITEQDQHVTAIFADGTEDTGDMLLGCDGIHSAVRSLFVDPDITPEYTGISNIFSLLPKSALSVPPASLNGLNATITTDGLFAVTSCTPTGDEAYWFSSREVPAPASGDSRDGWEEHRQKELDGFKGSIRTVLDEVKGSWGDTLRDVVDQTAVVKVYPVFRLPLGGAWSKERCLLLGDAAHAMPPHASQGVSMGLEDVYLLARVLDDPSRTLAQAFHKYEEKRRPRIKEIYDAAEQYGHLRRKTSGWRLQVNELAVAAGLGIYNTCKLQKLGLGQKPLVYDIESEEV